eukprot:c14888_g1_i1 orf=317-2365(-)
MEDVGVTPDIVTFLCVLKACAGVGALEQGRRAHDQVIRHKLDSSACSNSLIDMYAKCGSLDDARCVFGGLSCRNIVSWGALMAGYVENGDACFSFGLFEQMTENGVQPNRAVFLCIIKACICIGDIRKGRLVHFEVIKNGFDLELMVGNALMDLYMKFSCLEDALKVFDELPRPDIVSWDIRIAGLADNGCSFSALESYERMLSKGLKPDKYTYSCILKACAIEGVVCQGMLVHDQILRCGLESNVVIANTLIDMYGKCGCIGEACKVFHSLASRDVVSWGTMIACCVQNGFDGLALNFFERMHQDVVYPNKAVFMCALKACASAGTLVLGRGLHDQMIRGGLEIDLTVGSTLVNMYGNLGSLEEAVVVFNSMKDRNEVTWGLMIAAHVQHNCFVSAVGLFARMQREGMSPDKASFVGMLKGCSKLGAIIYGRLLHGQIIESGLVEDVEVGSALVDLYVKCGNSKDSLKVLEGVPGRNVALWCAQITSFACSGCFQEARECLKIMDRQGIKPDHAIFVSLLSACTTAGLLKEGCWFFASMRNDYGLEPGIEEYDSIVDLFGRAGLIGEAEDLLLSMPSSPDVLGWMSLLSCCKTFFNFELARRCFDQIVQLDSNDASGYVLMLSVSADAHMWDDLMKTNEHVHRPDPSKRPGASYTEVGQEIYEVRNSCFTEGGAFHANSSW